MVSLNLVSAHGAPCACLLTLLPKVNSATKSDCYPLPRLDDCIDRVGSAVFVTRLDLLKGYWQVPLTEQAHEISAFVTPVDFCLLHCHQPHLWFSFVILGLPSFIIKVSSAALMAVFSYVASQEPWA